MNEVRVLSRNLIGEFVLFSRLIAAGPFAECPQCLFIGTLQDVLS